jgi:glycosyltransferase involved in cell wall biosynthesis
LKKMRILEIVDTLDAGGMEHQLVHLINRLDPARFHFEVCCLRYAGVNAAKLAPHVTVHPLEKAEGFQPSTVQRLRQLLRRGFDVVHTHNLAPLIYAALATAGGLTHPLFHGEHAQLTPAELGKKRLWQRRLLYRCCRAVHTVSESQRQELLRIGLGHKKLIAIRNGVNTEHFTPPPPALTRQHLLESLGIQAEPGAVNIGIVARFGAYKRHLDLLRAFEALAARFPHTRLLMIGDGGPMKEQVLAAAQASPYSQRIHWAGYQKDPAPWYRVLDLLVVPSLNEGLSNTTLEAMSSGVPVLSHDNCGAREIIHSDAEGWVREMPDLASLSTHLAEILSLPSTTRQAVGKQARQAVSTRFSWSAMAEEYARWFEDCAH